MNRQQATHRQLTDRDDSVLIVVDVQQSFVDKLDDAVGPLLNRIRWTVEMAGRLEIPFYEWVRTLHFADEHLDADIWSGDRPDGVLL